MGHIHIVGSILGTAVGDAIGLPYEGLSRRRAAKLLGQPSRHRLFFGWGMVSDDTEHTCMVAQALVASDGNARSFQRQLAWRFRFWLISMPAGIGLATLKAILKLWCGFSPDHSGVFSAGNGPAMRAAILGAAIADLDQLRSRVRISSRLTHTDPKAEYGALAIALAARSACQTKPVSGEDFLHHLQSCLDSEAKPLIALIEAVIESVQKCEPTPQFAANLGLSNGVSGYVYHSVPIAIHAWLSHPDDFRTAITTTIECGGDTDSVAAMVGGIVGAGVGKAGIPAPWLNRIWEPGRSVPWMERLAIQLDSSLQAGLPTRPIGLPFLISPLRNVLFLVIVLFHGFRRLLPPY